MQIVSSQSTTTPGKLPPGKYSCDKGTQVNTEEAEMCFTMKLEFLFQPKQVNQDWSRWEKKKNEDSWKER